MSPAASLPLLPVLLPIGQSLGRPARNRLAPVWQFSIQPVKRSREGRDSTSPRTMRRRLAAIAAGVVVSSRRPGGVRFSSGSALFTREAAAPVERQKGGRAAGPPTRASSRFAQVLSLSSTAALHRSATDKAPFARFS